MKITYHLKSLFKISKAPIVIYIVIGSTTLFMAASNSIFSLLIQLGINFSLSKNNENIKYLALTFIITCLLFAISYYLLIVYKEKLIQYISENIKTNLVKKIIEIPINESVKYKNGDLLTRVVNDCDECAGYVVCTIIPSIQLSLSIIIGLVYTFYFAYPIAILTVLFLPIIYYTNYVSAKKITNLHKNAQESDGIQKNFFEEFYFNLPITKIYKMQHLLFEMNEKMYNNKYSKNIILEKRISKMKSFTDTSELTIELIILLFGMFLVSKNLLLVGVMVGVWNVSIGAIVYPISDLPSIFSSLARNFGSWDRIIELMNIEEEKNSEEQSILTYNKDNLSLIVNNISFSYNEKSSLLRNVSFELKIGDVIYLEGESGIGKTSILKLLLGFYKPFSGDIYISQYNNKITDIRPYFAYVPQKDYLFNMSLFENITLGSENAHIDEVVEVTELVGMHDYISSLPLKYDTIIGADFELSGGQAQKIAIARALLRKTPFIVFDEPYASLDNESLKKILCVIKKISKNKGCLIISHNSESFSIATKIITISEGNSYEKKV